MGEDGEQALSITSEVRSFDRHKGVPSSPLEEQCGAFRTREIKPEPTQEEPLAEPAASTEYGALVARVKQVMQMKEERRKKNSEP